MPDTSESPAARDALRAWLRRRWHYLVEPTADITDPDAQHQARLLASLLALLLPLLVVASLYWGVYIWGEGGGLAMVDTLAGGGMLVVWVGLFWLSRTRYHRLAARLLVVSLALTIFLISMPNPHYSQPTDMHAYFVLVVLLSSLVLEPRTTLVVILVLLGGMWLYPVVFADVHAGDLWLSFVALNSFAIWIGTTYARHLALRHQAALVADETRMCALLSAFPDLIFRMSADGVFLDYQTGDPTLLYRLPEEFVGRRVTEVMPPHIADMTLARIKRTLETRQMQMSEYVLVKDGRTHWSEARSVPLGDNEVLTVVRDITHRKQAELALDRTEEKHRALLDAIPDLIFRLNRQGVFLNYQAGKTGLAVPPEQFLGRNVREVLPSIAEAVIAAVDAALDTQQTQIVEYQLPLDDTVHDYEARLSPAGAGEVVAIVRDVTESKRAQADLRTSEARYRSLFDHSLNGFILFGMVFDEDGTAVDMIYLEANHGFEVQTGLRVDDVIGRRLSEVFEQEQAALLLKPYARVAQTGVPERVEVFVPGLEKHFSAAIFRPQPGQCAAVFMDVTDLVTSAATLRKSEARYRMLFEESPISLWEEDFSAVKQRIDDLRAAGVTDFAAYVDAHPEVVEECAQLVQVVNVNQATLALYGLETKDPLLGDLAGALSNAAVRHHFRTLLLTFASGKSHHQTELIQLTPDGTEITSVVTTTIVPDHADTWARVYVSVVDITEQKRAQAAEREQRTFAETLREITSMLTSTLDQEQVLDHVLALIRRVVPYEAANIALLDRDMARVVRSQGYEAHGYTDMVNTFEVSIAEFPTLQTMIATREPLLIPDTAADPRWQPLEVDQVMRSYIGAPIFWEDQVLGFFALQSSEAGFFTPVHADRLQALANQVAVALRNAQLYRAVQRHVSELETLQRTTLELTSQLQLDRLLHVLVELVLKLIDAPAGGVYLYRPEDDVLEWVVTVGPGLIPVGSRLKRGEGLSGKVWDQQKTITVDNYGEWSGRYTGYDGKGLIYDATMSVPIMWQGRILGVINVAADPAQRIFTDHDARLVELFAAQAAIAIQNAQLFTAEHEQRTLSDTLRATVAALNRTLDVDAVMEQLLLAIARVVPHDAANIMLFEDDEAVIAHHRGYDVHSTAEWIDQLRFPLNQRLLLLRSVRNARGFIIDDTHADPNWQTNVQSAWIRSVLCAPIRIEGKVLGVLNLDSATPHSFTERHLLYAQSFADQAALAIRNARLYAELRRHRDHLEHTVTLRTADLSLRNTVAETLSSSLDLDEMLYGVLKIVTERLGVRGGAIYLMAEDSAELQVAARHGVTPDQLARLDPNLAGIPGAEVVAGDLPFATVLTIPIWRKEQIEGVIMLVHDEPREWAAVEKEMLDAIGRQIGLSLANARSFMEAVEGEARIRTILQSVAEGLLVFDRDNNLLLMNSAARAMLAFYPQEYGGAAGAAARLWSWLRTFNSDAEAHVEFRLPLTPIPQTDTEALQAKCEVRHCWLARKDTAGWPCWLQPGEPLPNQVRRCAVYQEIQLQAIQAQTAEVHDRHGQPMGTVVALHDVTYFRELDELKGRFVSTVSHELRTPLSTILLQVSTLMKYYDRFDEAERRSMIKEMQEQSQILRDLIEDILELSRFDAHKSPPNKQWFDLVAKCHEVLGALELAISEKGLTLTLDGLRGSRYVMGDPNQIARVLRNLVNNAIKYTPSGGEITLRLRQLGSDISLAVSDTGIGMTPEEVAHVFDRFYRATRAIRMASGTGLGLAISKEIIDLHHGDIEVASVPGEGSTFTLKLPIGGADLLDGLDLPMP